MIFLVRKNNTLFKVVNGSFIDLPSPRRISILWNFGSLLGVCLITQILTGLFLAIHYTPQVDHAFIRVVHICIDVNYGWLIRTIHANGASFFFFCLFRHVGRGIYYRSYKYIEVWNVGVLLLFITIGTAFLGYVLPWGQISFWGATVITNLLSAVPYVGEILVKWLWGGFTIANATLTRFFTLHFLLPFIISLFRVIHLVFLHVKGSRNPLGGPLNLDKSPFHPYFSVKDFCGVIVLIIILLLIRFTIPYALGDPDNFIEANPIVTPVHIKPEWYFLFAYAILRSIPNKLGGVIALVLSIAVLFLLPISYLSKYKRININPLLRRRFWFLVVLVILLTWIGGCPVEAPYVVVGQLLTVIYFRLYIVNFLLIELITYLYIKY